MNAIPEEHLQTTQDAFHRLASREGSLASIASASTPVTRSGIKMGSVSLSHTRPMIRPLNPNSFIGSQFQPSLAASNGGSSDLAATLNRVTLRESSSPTSPSSDEDEESEESEWEQDVDQSGSVHYIVPYTVEEAAGLVQQPPVTLPGSSDASRSEAEVGGKKLSRLVRRRESKRDRSMHGNVVLKTPSGNDGSAPLGANPATPKGNPWRMSNSHESSDNDSSTYGQIKTFEAFFETAKLDRSVSSPAPPRASELSTIDEVTEIHEVTLKFQSKHLKAQIPHFQMLLHGENPANRGLLLEALLGIIPEMKPFPSEPVGTCVVDNSVVIAGFVPQGVASKAEDNLKCGDIIRSIDGHHVTLDTVNTFLLNKLTNSSAATGKVKLILQRPMESATRLRAAMSFSEADLSAKRQAIARQYSQLDDHSWSLLMNANVIAAIISDGGGADENSSSDAPTVMYLLPDSERQNHAAKVSSGLISVRGILSTLVQLLPDVVSSLPLSSSLLLRSQPLSEGSSAGSQESQWLHVSYVSDGDEILLLGVPASRLSDCQGRHLVTQISRFLKLKYGSLLNAALGPSSHETDNVIGKLVFNTLFGRASGSSLSRHVESFIDETSTLQLPDDVQFQVEDALNQFESSDFQDFSDDLYDLPREFIISGSCVLHRGHVIASHLTKQDLMDVMLWLRCTSVSDLTQEHPVRKVVLWHELHGMKSTAGSMNTRRFLLISGLGYQLIGVILEAGGFTADPSGSISPDPFYVDQAVNTLEHLSEMGIPLVCEKWLTLPLNPSLLNIDQVISASANVKKLDLRSENQETNCIPGIVLKRTKSLELSESSSGTSRGGSPPLPRLRDRSSDDNSLNYEMSTAFRGDDKDDVSSHWELPRHDRRPFITNSIRSSASASGASSSTTENEREDLVTYHISRLTVSLENTLIYYLHLRLGDGLFIAPIKHEGANVFHLQRLLLENFFSAVEIVHGFLQLSSNQRQNLSSSISSSDSSKWTSRSLVAVKEHGMLFRWSPSETMPVFSYWVCGRLFMTPEPKECFVAYHESTPQQMVELAFRLAFGTKT